MKGSIRLSISRRLWLPPLFILIALSAACGGRDQGPVLVIPTPAVTAVVPTAGVGQLTAEPATPTAAPALPTATLPPAPTIDPPVATPTAAPLSTATPLPLPSATSVSVAPPGYQVAFVAANDTLNVRRQPNANAAVVTELPANATGIQVIGQGQSIRGGSLWLPVATSAGDGWVNSRFLTEAVSSETFCADLVVNDLLSRLQKAVAEKDGKMLAELVHPDRGLRLRLNWWNEEIIVEGNDIQTLFRSQKKFDWGIEDGSGLPIRGSFSDVALPRLEKDLLGATQWNCDEGLFGPTAGITILPEGYEAVRFYSAHRPAPAEQEMDWGTWLVGVERWEGRYYVSYLVHYRWEI